MFERYRAARPASLVFPPAIVALYGWAVARRPFAGELLLDLENVTRGLATPGFVLAVVATLLVLLTVRLAGRIELDDAGLNRDYLGRGIGVVAMIWGAAQVLGVLPRVVANRPVQLSREFEFGSRWEMGGDFLTSLGVATLEEIVFRGVLLVQLYLLFRRWNEEWAPPVAAVLTAIVANLACLPRSLPYPSFEVGAADQAILFAGGLFLSWLYFRTRNLFFAIGVHSLLVAPPTIVAGPRGGGAWFHPLVIAILASLWALLWPRRDASR